LNHIVVLSGSGISADSGLATFRGSGGLWEGYNIEEVASVHGWQKDREKVLEFYNRRREQLDEVEPNSAHYALADLERFYDVTVVTQNVDNLHERAGSSNVIHLHGLLSEARSENDPNLVVEIGTKPIKLGDLAEDGTQLRPNVVWFGEAVPMMEKAIDMMMDADTLIVVGTSLTVYPAASLIHYTDENIPKYLIDPSEPEVHLDSGWEHIQERAAIGLPNLTENLLNR
jgi:NAD-dependent deacetylase